MLLKEDEGESDVPLTVNLIFSFSPFSMVNSSSDLKTSIEKGAVCGFTSMIIYVNKINMINKTTTDKIY